MTTEMIIKLIRGLLPITLIIVTCIIIKKTTKKQFEGITHEPLAGMRYPTEEEANIIKNQVISRERIFQNRQSSFARTSVRYLQQQAQTLDML